MAPARVLRSTGTNHRPSGDCNDQGRSETPAIAGFTPVSLDQHSRFNFGRNSSQFGVTMIADDHQGVWFFIPGIAPTRWDFAQADWRGMACQAAGRAMTDDEWRQAVGTENPGTTVCGPGG